MSDADGDPVPWRAFHREAEQRLTAAGFETAGHDARRIVEQAAGFEGAEFHLGLDEFATRRGVVAFDAMLGRRLAGEPLQYVVGRWGFRTLDLMVDRRVLIPRPETEVVAGLALAELARQQPVASSLRAADLGTGSGAIGLSLAAESPVSEVWLSDRSADALAVARANLVGLGRTAERVTVVEGSWFDALPRALAGTFHVVVSNPPYIAASEELPSAVVDWEPPDALVSGHRGTEALDVLVDGAGEWLVAGGALVLEMAPHQVEPVAERARSAGYADVDTAQDLAGRLRAVVARWPG